MKVVDMHCDTISELLHARERGEEASILENHLHIDLIPFKQDAERGLSFAEFCHVCASGKDSRPISLCHEAG